MFKAPFDVQSPAVFAQASEAENLREAFDPFPFALIDEPTADPAPATDEPATVPDETEPAPAPDEEAAVIPAGWAMV
jgi:hypothetical protein